MQEQIYDFSFESYKYTYMQPKKFKSMFNDTTYLRDMVYIPTLVQAMLLVMAMHKTVPKNI